MTKFEKKTAVILFNLGGPTSLESVKPFLFNLFNDKAIINIPQPFRFLLAQLISTLRLEKSKNIYRQLGGKSPLLEITNQQASLLEKELSFYGNFKVFVSMRYWKPFAKDVIKKIDEYNPSEVILLPLYPQFSSTTSGSSIEDFLYRFSYREIPTKIVCCYATDPDFIQSHVNIITQKVFESSIDISKTRFLFSAHGLPKKIIDKGDPYVFQIKKTTDEIIKILSSNFDNKSIDFSICYQSKVGPMEWTSPNLDYEIRRSALDKKDVVIVPISFVSNHSETLVELDIEYRKLASNLGIKNYIRIPALDSNGLFIKSLVNMCKKISGLEGNFFSSSGANRICPKSFKMCINDNKIL